MSGDDTVDLPDSAKRSASFPRWMVAGIALLNLIVFGIAAVALYQGFDRFEQAAAATAQNLCRLLSLDIASDIDKIDLALLSATEEIERQAVSGGIDQRALNAFLSRLRDHLPEIVSLRMIDAAGIARYGPGRASDALPDRSDPECFIRQRDNSLAGLVIAKALRGSGEKRWVVPMSRPIHHADGSFAGVVCADVALEHLMGTFGGIEVGRRRSISLRDAELRILARYPVPADTDKVIGEVLAVPELHDLIQAGREAQTYTSNHTIDGIERSFTVRRIPNHALYAVIGTATDEYRARWRALAVEAAALATLFCLTTLMSSWLIYRNWRRQVAVTMELAREEEKFRTVADYTYDWEYWEGPGRDILYMSPSCLRMTGYAKDEFVTDPELLYSIIQPEDQHLMEAHRQDAGHEDIAGVDFRIVRRDGEVRWIAHGCHSVFSRGGKFMGRRASNRDITERKDAEAAVRQLNAELEQRVAQRTTQLEAANRELEEFSYSMSHDMLAPLRAIDGFSKILVEEYGARLDDEGKRLLAVVRDNGKRMGQLINDILRFLRIGKRKMDHGDVDVAQLAREAFAQLQATMPQRRLRLDIGELPSAWGDREMIREVILNLLSNAIKFSPPGAEESVIEVCGRAEGAENVYHVKDYGVGFDMQYVNKLFRVFERVHPTGQYEGTGIGLAMVKRIIDRHGGRVSADGKVGEGAVFHFSLPNRRT